MLDLLEAEPELPAIYKYTTDVLAGKADVAHSSGVVAEIDDMFSSLASYSSTSPSSHEELATTTPQRADVVSALPSGFLILED